MKINSFFANILVKARRRSVASNHEPQIKQKCDRDGNQYWLAYDPNTNKSYTFSSEQDVRVWIEDRYHYLN